MEPQDVLEVLLELAAEAGLRVRIAGREARGADAMPLSSGICRVRGEWWVVLASGEPVAAQIRILVDALRRHAGELLETRHLPPAVRAAIDAASGPAGSG